MTSTTIIAQDPADQRSSQPRFVASAARASADYKPAALCTSLWPAARPAFFRKSQLTPVSEISRPILAPTVFGFRFSRPTRINFFPGGFYDPATQTYQLDKTVPGIRMGEVYTVTSTYSEGTNPSSDGQDDTVYDMDEGE
jgi:hypothetical protein